MPSSTPSCALAGALVLCACLMLPSFALAQESEEPVVMPTIGTRHVMVGMVVEPGVASGDIKNSRFEAGASYAQMAHIGVLQVINRQLALGAGAQAGMQWIDDHGLAPQGRAPSERAFAFGFDLHAHWLFMGTLQGPSVGTGVRYHRAAFDQGAAQVMSVDLLAGWLLWTKANQMIHLRVGYHYPLVQGLSAPQQFGLKTETLADWNWRRASLAISWSL